MDPDPEMELFKDGLEILRTKFPAASSDILHSGAHHVYAEPPDAARDLLAWIGLFLQQRDREQHEGLHRGDGNPR